MRSSSMLLGLLLSANAAAQELSPSLPLPGDLTIGPAAGDQSRPVMAAGGDQVLLVWQDARNDLDADLLLDQTGWDIHAARLDASGALIDTFPIVVNQDPADQTTPEVAWNGSVWLVTWMAQVETEFYWTSARQAARVAPDGTVLDPVPLTLDVDSAAGTVARWGIASDGDAFLVFWKTWNGASWNLLGQRIAGDGTLLDDSPVTLVTNITWQPGNADVAFAGGRWLVVWSEWTGSGEDDLRGRLFFPDLSPASGKFTIANHFYYEVFPAVAGSDTGFYVTWERYHSCCVGGGGQVFGTRVSNTGAVLDGTLGVALNDLVQYGSTGRRPDVVWDGECWVVAMLVPGAGGQQTWVNRVSAAGLPLDGDGFPVDAGAGYQAEASVAVRPAGGALLAWADARAGGVLPLDVRTAVLSGGLAQPLGVMTLGAPAQIAADAVREGGVTTIAFLSAVSGGQRVLAQRVGPDGSALDAAPVAVSPLAADVWNPSIAHGDGNLLVTWDSASGVKARRITPDLQWLDPAPIAVMPGSQSDVAALGSTYLVVAVHSPSNPHERPAWSRRVDGATGAVLDGSSVLFGWSFANAPSVTAFDGGFVAAWQRNFSHDDAHADVRVRWISAANVPGVELVPAGGLASFHRSPALAASPTRALLTWHALQGGGDATTFAVQLLPGGSVAGPGFAVSTAPLEQVEPDVAWTGSEFALAWEDHRAETWLLDERSDVFGARVGEAGLLKDPLGFAIADGSRPQAGATVAGAGGSATYAWSSFESGAPYAGWRVMSRVLSPSATASPWLDLGGGTAGAAGTPSLSGDGSLAGGTPVSLHLDAAPPTAVGLLWLTTTSSPVAALGGTVHALPYQVQALLATDAAGTFDATTTWPAGVPSGTSVWFQTLLQDGSVPSGLLLSNGLKGNTP